MRSGAGRRPHGHFPASNIEAGRTIRLFDIVISLLGILVLLLVGLLILVIGYLDTRSPLFLQERVGIRRRTFTLIKFRTMQPNTDSVGTHLVDSSSVTPLGRFLRRSKLDEIPQLINVLRGDMSLVGPRPCLPNQLELIEQRDQRGVYRVRPGLTGLAQVNGINMSTPKKLARYDALMIQHLSLSRYFCLILATAIGRGSGDHVRH